MARGDLQKAVEVAELLPPDKFDVELVLVQIFTDAEMSEYVSKKYLSQDHQGNNDYIRLCLYSYLIRKGYTGDAKELLEERWQQIDPNSWMTMLNEIDSESGINHLFSFIFG